MGSVNNTCRVKCNMTKTKSATGVLDDLKQCVYQNKAHSDPVVRTQLVYGNRAFSIAAVAPVNVMYYHLFLQAKLQTLMF